MSEYTGCDKCQHNNKADTEYPCNNCTHNSIDHYKPMTNADRIQNMPLEELANSSIYFVSDFVAREELCYTGLDGHYYKTGKEVYEANMKWLQAEVGDAE